jgi:hypothetical protein
VTSQIQVPRTGAAHREAAAGIQASDPTIRASRCQGSRTRCASVASPRILPTCNRNGGGHYSELEQARVACLEDLVNGGYTTLVREVLIFAAPAPAATDEHGARAAFLRAWPTGAVDAASDHAASLRLRADLAVDAALIAAVTAGCAQALLRARTGELELAARARIHDDGDVRIVTMPLEAIRIAIRKAGIDRDPGWVPWLERHVRIVFDENS